MDQERHLVAARLLVELGPDRLALARAGVEEHDRRAARGVAPEVRDRHRLGALEVEPRDARHDHLARAEAVARPGRWPAAGGRHAARAYPGPGPVAAAAAGAAGAAGAGRVAAVQSYSVANRVALVTGAARGSAPFESSRTARSSTNCSLDLTFRNTGSSNFSLRLPNRDVELLLEPAAFGSPLSRLSTVVGFLPRGKAISSPTESGHSRNLRSSKPHRLLFTQSTVDAPRFRRQGPGVFAHRDVGEEPCCLNKSGRRIISG